MKGKEIGCDCTNRNRSNCRFHLAALMTMESGTGNSAAFLCPHVTPKSLQGSREGDDSGKGLSSLREHARAPYRPLW